MYCIMRMEKRKKQDVAGLQREATRTALEYNNRVVPGMEIYNQTLQHSNDWLADIQQEIDAAGAKVRSNSVMALDTIYTASKEFFQLHDSQTIDEFFWDCLDYHRQHYGHVVSAIVHYDEDTPHMHVLSVPLTRDGRLSAREIVGGRAQMAHAQDSFFEQVGQQYGLQRGVHMDGPEKRKHITAQQHRLQELQAQVQHEERQLAQLQHRADQTLQQLRTQTEQVRHAQSDLQELQGYLTDAERARAQKIQERYDDFEH
jgi:hypothetical protein